MFADWPLAGGAQAARLLSRAAGILGLVTRAPRTIMLLNV
jgi:hypothetical protein